MTIQRLVPVFIALFIVSACEDSAPGSSVPQTPSVCTLDLCGTECVDTATNSRHCGACDNACGANEQCMNRACVPVATACEGGKVSCNGQCVDVLTDSEHCGECNTECGDNMSCQNAACLCNEGFADFDGEKITGCEQNLAEASCSPLDVTECFDAESQLAGVGICRKGHRLCFGGIWDVMCIGQITPRVYDQRYSNYDLNCNGIIDKNEDIDADGFTKGDGDCCDDKVSCNVENPELVNPTALEMPDDKIDNNCNGLIDEAPTTCPALYDAQYPKGVLPNSALALIYAMDLCMPVVSQDSKMPGLIDFRVQSNDSGRAVDALAINALSMLQAEDGHKLLPKLGPSFALLSSGYALDANSGFDGTYFAKSGKSSIPSLFAQAHGMQLETAPQCRGVNEIYDMASLQIKMRVPSNAKGFKFKFRFFSVEYPRYICTQYNDFFLALLESGHADIPEDKNISFDKLGNPVSVNNAFFTSCVPITCSGDTCPSTMHCDAGQCKTYVNPADPSLGYNIPCPDGDTGNADTSTFNTGTDRGGTAWLETSAPVIPGEVITLTFYIWDTGDQKLDSSVIIDAFEWSTVETELGTEIVN